MSRENVQVFKRGLDAFNRRDVEDFLSAMDRDIEWHPAMQALIGGQETTYTGHDGLREMLEDFSGAFAWIEIEAEHIRDIGDRVVATGHLRARGRESGAEIESGWGFLGDFQDGRIVRARTYLDSDEALEAAGLRD